MLKTHQIYGPSAVVVACGKTVTNKLKTALPGSKVTCDTCNRIEETRRQEARARGGR